MEEKVLDSATALDSAWLMLCAFLVFFMQAGFAMYEAGCVPQYSTRNVLFKNIIDLAISSLGWWTVGYAISAQDPVNSPFMGRSQWFASDTSQWPSLIFGWGFCATTSTIDSGATIGRIKLPVYLLMNFASGWLLYPFFSHWAWGGGLLLHAGTSPSCCWLQSHPPIPCCLSCVMWSAFGIFNLCCLLACVPAGFLGSSGYIDFAGSGVIHMTGGLCGLVAASLLGPRLGRWTVREDGSKQENLHGSSIHLTVLGTFILYFCWFGFNCGSSLGLTGGLWEVSAIAGVNTFIASTGAVLTMLVLDIVRTGTYSVENSCNAVLSGKYTTLSRLMNIVADMFVTWVILRARGDYSRLCHVLNRRCPGNRLHCFVGLHRSLEIFSQGGH